MDLGPGSNLERELVYDENHSSADKHTKKVREKAVGDVKTGRATVIPARLARMV